MPKYKYGICAFCGMAGEVTDDHVPPQSLFPRPRSNQIRLITVPGCYTCNQGSNVDDEDFKVFISLKAGLETPERARLHQSTKRTVRHNQRIRRRLSSANRLYLPSNARSGFSEVAMIPFTSGPISRVLRKVVLGLYFHHFGEVICNVADVSIILPDLLPDSKTPHLQEITDEIARSGKFASIGDANEFLYRYAESDEKYGTGWLFSFYGQAGAIGLTTPKGACI